MRQPDNVNSYGDIGPTIYLLDGEPLRLVGDLSEGYQAVRGTPATIRSRRHGNGMAPQTKCQTHSARGESLVQWSVSLNCACSGNARCYY